MWDTLGTDDVLSISAPPPRASCQLIQDQRSLSKKHTIYEVSIFSIGSERKFLLVILNIDYTPTRLATIRDLSSITV